jgi:hypothetical protein
MPDVIVIPDTTNGPDVVVVIQEGPQGPNTVSTSTSTDITGVLYGNGTVVSAATAAQRLGSFTKAQLNASVSDGNVLYVGETAPRVILASNLVSTTTPDVGKATVVYTRSLPGSYLLPNGLWASADSGVPTFTYDTVSKVIRYKAIRYRRDNAFIGRSQDLRDLTQVGWVPTNVTVAKTQTGIDGVANACSLLTATSANATILNPNTLASSVRTFSAFIRRVAGSGWGDGLDFVGVFHPRNNTVWFQLGRWAIVWIAF